MNEVVTHIPPFIRSVTRSQNGFTNELPIWVEQRKDTHAWSTSSSVLRLQQEVRHPFFDEYLYFELQKPALKLKSLQPGQ